MITKVSKFGRLLLSQYFWKYIGDTKSTLSPHHHHHTPPQAQQRSKKPRLNRVNILNSLLPHQPSAKSRKDQKFDCNPKHFIPIQKYSTAQIQNHIDIDEELLTGHFDPEKSFLHLNQWSSLRQNTHDCSTKLAQDCTIKYVNILYSVLLKNCSYIEEEHVKLNLAIFIHVNYS